MCKSESISQTVKELNKIDTVTETNFVDGPWKIIVKLESESLDHIRDAIRWKLRKTAGIETTLTLVQYMK